MDKTEFILLPREYQVVIDPLQSLEDLIAAGRYDAVAVGDSDPGNELWHRSAGEYGGTRRLRLAQFCEPHTISDAGSILYHSGFTGAGLYELFAFGAAFPDVQTRFPVTGWLACWTVFGDPDTEDYALLCGSDRAIAADSDRLLDRWLFPKGDIAAGFRFACAISPWQQQWDDGKVNEYMARVRFLVCVDETS